MAIACLRLLTVFPLLPDLSVPFFRRRIALSTRFDAAFPYFRFPEDFRAAIVDPPFSVVGCSYDYSASGWLTLCRRMMGHITRATPTVLT
jgi:hypothetical protein